MGSDITLDWSVRPKLGWWLEFHRVTVDEKDVIFVKDPRGIAEGPVAFPVFLAPLVYLFDGTRTLAVVAEEVAPHIEASGGATARELVSKVYQEFDKLFLFENQRTDERLVAVKQNYADLAVRPAVFAGSVYPAEATELRAQLTKYIRSPDTVLFRNPQGSEVRAVMCPHIDYARGWRGYGAAYSIMDQAPKPDLVVIFGTSHYHFGKTFFHLTKKPFDTPFGRFNIDIELVNNLASNYGEARCFADEFTHKAEHSIELQLPLLGYRYEKEPKPLILPILVGSFHDFLRTTREPIVEPDIVEFVDILVWLLNSLKRNGTRILIYSAVDLAHVGLQFGDAEGLSDAKLKTIRELDMKLLESIYALDDQALYFHLAADENRRRVCGFPALYTMISVLRRLDKRTRGYFVDYQQVVDERAENLVTYAASAWCSAVNSPS